MRVAIIGAGNVGGALAGSAVEAGHEVTVSSSDPEDAERQASDTGATAAADNVSAVENAEVVILAVPFPALEGLAHELKGILGGKVVVDVTNRLDPEDPVAMIDGTSAAEMLQAWLPDVAVVKAFNTALAARQADPEVRGMRSDGFVAGDDEAAKRKVLDLVESIGFRPVDAGPLGMARGAGSDGDAQHLAADARGRLVAVGVEAGRGDRLKIHRAPAPLTPGYARPEPFRGWDAQKAPFGTSCTLRVRL